MNDLMSFCRLFTFLSATKMRGKKCFSVIFSPISRNKCKKVVRLRIFFREFDLCEHQKQTRFHVFPLLTPLPFVILTGGDGKGKKNCFCSSYGINSRNHYKWHICYTKLWLFLWFFGRI